VRPAGLLVLVALLGVLIGREVRRVRSASVELDGRRVRPALVAELVLLAACVASVLPRLIDLLT
jgi:hypothetical protein